MAEIKFANYGQERRINATDEEYEMFDMIKSVTGLDRVRMVRKSDNYVTAVYKGWDLARFKFTQRAKWISFPSIEVGSVKHRIQNVSEVTDFKDMFDESLETIHKFTKK